MIARRISLEQNDLDPEVNLGLGGTRTHNQRLKRALLYH
jgi:hypothetical protein